MILSIILLVVIVLVLAIVILFSFYFFLPSIGDKKKMDDPIFAESEINYKINEEENCKVSKDMKAIVMCSCDKDFKLKRTVSNQGHTCFMAKTVQGSGVDCKYACIGLGDCAKVCPQGAISIVNNTAVISSSCCGCGDCLEVCPQHIIKLIPKNQEKITLCNNLDESDLTSCTARFKEVKIDTKDKKDFKIWSSCYRMLRSKKEK